jgi:predicted  nucleic acid-binding Zn-ribbon protein
MADSETLKLLRSIDGRLGSVETRLGGIETHVGGIETRLSGVETRMETLETVTARAPDLRLLGHQMATLIERVTGLEASNTRAIAALNDIARESVTPGEVEALHSEMNELRNAKFNHEVRISATRGRTEYRAFDSTSAAVTLNRAARSPSSR